MAERVVESTEQQSIRVALLGNPNTGKTTLFNQLCGVRHKTSNYPGTTQEARIGFPGSLPSGSEIIDLPGAYSLSLDHSESALCRRTLTGETAPVGEPVEPPDVVVLVVDATNLSRNMMLAAEALELGLPTVILLTMVDLARKRGIAVDSAGLSQELGCQVIECDPRRGGNMGDIPAALLTAGRPKRLPHMDEDARVAWADSMHDLVCGSDASIREDRLTGALDRLLIHPLGGLMAFAVIMTGLFFVIFKVAEYPMGWIEFLFGTVGGWLTTVMPEGVLQSLLVDGALAGVGSTVIFLPQICLLFFLIALLEDTGYLARASFVIDRLMQPFGLSGHAFVPFLSSHACALPGIMACRGVPGSRERLATILVAPFMSCTARMPVYVLLTVLLFPGRPSMQALAFAGCYVVGIAAGLLSALLARRTLLRGSARPMAIELPPYRIPSLRTAVLTTWDRGWVFLRKAGTVIFAISVVLWWLSAYPVAAPPAEAIAMQEEAALVVESDPEYAASLEEQAVRLSATAQASGSMLGRMGAIMEPVFRPLGYDRQLTVGVLASFAAREVFVATMTIQVLGVEVDDPEAEGFLDELATASRSDRQTPIFTAATSWSLLLYYVLAMQCLPTLAVTARESGHWKWALLQFAWMCGLAYVSALTFYQILRAIGVG